MTEADWASCTNPTTMLAFLGTAGRASSRKLDLFSVACCRRVLLLLARDYVAWCPRTIEVHERYADGFADEEEFQAIKARASQDAHDAAAAIGNPGEADFYAVWHAANAATAIDAVLIAWGTARAIAYDAVAKSGDSTLATITAAWQRGGYLGRARWDEDEKTVATLPAFLAAYAAERAQQADLIRCIFGNPVGPDQPLEASLLMTEGHLIRVLAHAAYDDRKPDGSLEPAGLTAVADALEESGYADKVLLGHLRSPLPHVRGCFALDLILSRECSP